MDLFNRITNVLGAIGAIGLVAYVGLACAVLLHIV